MPDERTAKDIKSSFDEFLAHGSPEMKAGLQSTCNSLDAIKTKFYGTWWKSLWRRLRLTFRRDKVVPDNDYILHPLDCGGRVFRISDVSKRRARYQEREAKDCATREKFSL